MLSPEEEVLLAATDVYAIVREAGLDPSIGTIHYDRMHMPYVWVSWIVERENRTYHNGTSLRSRRRERLRIDMFPSGIALTRWDLGTVAARGYHREVMAAYRRRSAGRRLLARVRAGESVGHQHIWKAHQLIDEWKEIWHNLTGLFDN